MLIAFTDQLPCTPKQLQDELIKKFVLKQAVFVGGKSLSAPGTKHIKISGPKLPSGEEFKKFLIECPALNQAAAPKAAVAPVKQIEAKDLSSILDTIKSVFGDIPGIVDIIMGILKYIEHVGQNANSAVQDVKNEIADEVIQYVAFGETDMEALRVSMDAQKVAHDKSLTDLNIAGMRNELASAKSDIATLKSDLKLSQTFIDALKTVILSQSSVKK